MNKVAGAVILMLLPALVEAEPVYLECNLIPDISEDGTRSFAVTLDEATGRVTHSFSPESIFIADGFFTANKIVYQKKSVGEGWRMTTSIEINRMNLAVVETFTSEDGDRVYEVVGGVLTGTYGPLKLSRKLQKWRGVCEIVKAPKRKI